MSPVTHFFAGWVLASVSPVPLTRREKALVTAAAVAPDIDGLGIVPELLTRHSAHPLLWFSQYHHTLHTLAFALICTFAAYLFDRSSRPNGPSHPAQFFGSRQPFRSFTFGPAVQGRRPLTHPWFTALLVFLSFHLHLLCDLVGARGPDGDQWPIPYLKPFSNSLELTWHGQWALNAWQNFVVTGLLLAATLWIARKYGSSPVELMSERGNRAFVDSLSKSL